MVFKDENGHDVRPPDGTMISYVLFASNDTGTFFADSDAYPLEPERELRPGLFKADGLEVTISCACACHKSSEMV